MTKKGPWAYHEIQKFLSLLRKHSLIWDPDHPDFRNQFKREIAYSEISYEMNCTTEFVKRKLHIMRSQYLAEYKLLKSKKRSKPVWQYFDDMKFIYKHEDLNFDDVSALEMNNPLQIGNDEGTTTIADRSMKQEEKDGGEDQLFAKEFENFSNKSYGKKRRLPPTSQDKLNSTKVKKIDEDLSQMNSSIQDEFTVLGLNVATEMRLLNQHESIQNELKSNILRAIREAKYAIQRL